MGSDIGGLIQVKTAGVMVLALAFFLTAGAFYVPHTAEAWGEIEETSIFESTEDYDGDGNINYLVVNVPVTNASWYGNPSLRDFIEVYAELWNENSTDNIMVFKTEFDILPYSEDSLLLDVRFSGREINASGVDGPYLAKLSMVHYVGIYSFSFIPVISEDLGYFEYVTDEYSHEDFETPDPFAIEAAWETVDEDENGLYDLLRVNVTVDAVDEDIVQVLMELDSGYGPDVMSYTDERVLPFGDNLTFYIDIDGRLMNGLSLESNRYYIFISFTTLDGFDDWLWVKTDPLNSTDFEEYIVSCTDGPTSELVDVNDDGLFDFLRVAFNATSVETFEYILTVEISNENDSWFDLQYFDGYLIDGLEETVIVYFDTSEMYELGVSGPLDFEVFDSPTMHGLWPNYTYIASMSIATGTVEELDLDQLNHPEYVFISGYVADEGGAPVAGAVVSMSCTHFGWQWTETETNMTDVDGFYNVTMVIPDAPVSLNVESEGYFQENRYESGLESNTTGYNFTLVPDTPADSTIWGTVLGSDGEPAWHTEISLIRAGSGVAATIEPDEEGNYSVDIRSGDYVMFTLAMFVDFEIFDVSLDYAIQWISLSSGDSVNIDITVNHTYGMTLTWAGAESHRSLSFDDWDNLAMTDTLEIDGALEDTVLLLGTIADAFYGNADQYVDENESQIIEDSIMPSLLLMGSDYYLKNLMQCELYLLEDFCVDGIAFVSQPEDVRFSLSGMTGSIWDKKDNLTLRLEADSLESYWPIRNDSTHEVFLEVQYSEYSDFSEYVNIYEVEAPDGYILTSTNLPYNVTIEGMNRVSVVPGESDDPYSTTNALVALEFSSTMNEGQGSVLGTVTLEGESDFSGITVELLGSNLTALASTATVSNGEFVFSYLDPGEYWIRANLTGYLDDFEKADVTAGESTEVTLELQAAGTAVDLGGFCGSVVNQAGLPVAGVTVEVFNPADGTVVTQSTQTAENGTFELAGLDQGAYRIEISAEGFENLTLYRVLDHGEDMDLGQIELFSYSPVGYIVGTLEDGDGNPIQGVIVEVRAEGTTTVLGESTTGPDGSFTIIGLEDGAYNLTFILEGEVIGYADVEVEDFVGDAGVVVIDLQEADVEAEGFPWYMVALAVVVVALVALAIILRSRKPKAPQPVEQGEDELPPQENT